MSFGSNRGKKGKRQDGAVQKLRQARLRPKLHIEKVVAEVTVLNLDNPFSKDPKQIIDAQVALSDFSATGVKMFCREKLPYGTTVVLSVSRPRNFFAKGRIKGTEKITSDWNIQFKDAYPVRLYIEFIFKSEEERKAVADYCKELSSELMIAPKRRAA